MDDRLASAKNGDFVVFQINQLITLIVIKKIEKERLYIEEICIPNTNHSIKDWKRWVEQKAPGHTSWISYQIDLTNKKINDAYSLTQKSKIALSAEDSFILKLFELSFDLIPDKNRRKIGPEPMDGSLDTRKIWTPLLVMEGKKISSPIIEATTATWPKDNSELSGKKIECYFFQEKDSFPLPFWIQITDDSEARFNIIGIDCGKNLYNNK
ncbi:MAG: hypothetical protein HY860_05950 [Chlamydiales bacterium]|nr:hypothetical protein [Chlamydiales bacterium]